MVRYEESRGLYVRADLYTESPTDLGKAMTISVSTALIG